ncbi:MAG: hypothetical protein IJA82_07135 [Clostridia bacterium]|nr:hypothetical protein [Clostridia bacterium]
MLRLNTRYFYSKLNKYEKRLYRQIAKSLLKESYVINHDLTWDKANMIEVFSAVIDDFPELFYVQNSYIDWGVPFVLKVRGIQFYKHEEIVKIRKELDKIYHKFDSITDPFELQVAVTDFICKEYTYCDSYRGPKTRQEMHSIVGLIKRKRGVCSAFSQLAQYIFQRRGIPTAYVVAESKDKDIDPEKSAHAWLAIKHGDSYYHWDITSIHTEARDEETTQYSRFNVTDEEMQVEYDYPSKRYYDLVCNKKEYNYSYKRGLYLKTNEEIRQACQKFIKEMDYTKETNWLNFRVAPEIDTEDSKKYIPTPEEINEILKDTGYGFSKYNSFFYRDGQGYFRCKFTTKRKRPMKLTVIQPKYHWEESPCKNVREYLLEKLSHLEGDEIMVLPEYSNAGGTKDPEVERENLSFAKEMKESASREAKKKSAYVAVNVLEKRGGKIRNSTYLYGKDGEVVFVYDKVHLPPAEKDLGVERGTGECTCVHDDIRFAFMTCYDVYFNEQIEHIAKFKPDIIIVPGYQRGEQVDIIKAQATLLAYRCNAYVLRSSYTMGKDNLGGCTLIATPIGKIVANLGKEEGTASINENIKQKCYRPAGFGGEFVLNDKFIDDGLCPEAFKAFPSRGRGTATTKRKVSTN